jgi:CheY-like chemotaxis protein
VQRVLIADDDPVSLRFLAAAIGQFGCDVVAVVNGAAALAATLAEPFHLLLLDRRMPGLGGGELLLAMRNRGDGTPAIATSADIDAIVSVQLRDAGFVDVIEKPTTLAILRRVLGPHLHFSASPVEATDPEEVASALLDDSPALAAMGGDAAALRALRDLLAQELIALVAQREDFTGDRVVWRDRLHRLRASCGFCGAVALAQAAGRLDRALRDDPENAPSVLRDFLLACHATLSALRDQAPPTMGGARTSPSIPQARKPPPSR